MADRGRPRRGRGARWTPPFGNIRRGPKTVEIQKGPRRLGKLKLGELSSSEPGIVIAELINERGGFKELLHQTDLSEGMCAILLRVLARACLCDSAPANLIKILGLLQDSNFLKRCVPCYLTRMVHELSVDIQQMYRQPIKDILTILTDIGGKLPHSLVIIAATFDILDMTITSLKKSTTIIDQEIDRALLVLNEMKMSVFQHKTDEKLLKSAVYRFEKVIPPESYRDISIFPELGDIHIEATPFLRVNKATGKYDDADHYLDVQFRLLREDFIYPLREGIKEYNQELQNCGRVKKRLQDIKVYNDVRILCPACTDRHLCFTLAFNTTNLEKVNWKVSKRLIYGTMLCLSADNFKTMLFATVADRDVDKLQQGHIDVKFECPLAEITTISSDARFTMAETSAYFEAYRHVLKGLQDIGNETLAFQDYIINCENDVKLPAYLRRNRLPKFDLRPLVDRKKVLEKKNDRLSTETTFSRKSDVAKDVNILQTEDWPSADLLHLDDSQLRAVQAALTQEFSITQGPPGTGKTYIGLQIVRILLHNSEAWNPRNGILENEHRPMLIVCYTNHALDQFLEGIVNFYKGHVVRVGSRSKSELLKAHTLNEQKRKMRDDRLIPPAVRAGLYDIKSELEVMMQNINKYAMQLNVSSTGILHEDTLRPYIMYHHYSHLVELDQHAFFMRANGKNATSSMVNWLQFGEVMQSNAQEPAPVPYMPPDDLIDVLNEIDAIENMRKLDDDSDDEQLVDKRTYPAPGRVSVALDMNRIVGAPTQRRQNPGNDGGWEMTRDQKKQMKRNLRKELMSTDQMTHAEIRSIRHIWALNVKDRWRLYRFWVSCYCEYLNSQMTANLEKYDEIATRYTEMKYQEDKVVMRKADVLGMTTTGAARYLSILQEIEPRIIIVEEAAEVLEAHVVTAVTRGCEHLVLIGDHQQLRPNPSVYKLAKDYNLQISLFERMLNNGMPCATLELQHRMRPEIARVLLPIYPNLRNDPCVLKYEKIRGISCDMFFVSHAEKESQNEELRSHANEHEARYLVRLCRYLMLQGYDKESITVLTTYSGQLFQLRNLMPKSEFGGVQVTVVDNYQGEENDIILLSLVRSNDLAKIGFLNIDNRVCVALSRAKKGFFVIGNFELLAQNSRLWKTIVADLGARDLIGPALTLQCQNHPKGAGISVQMPEDFSNAPEGGCSIPCEYRLSCGHVCRLACHPYDADHKEYECRKPCTRKPCDVDGHKCPRRCNQKCTPCSILVEKVVPKCQHSSKIPCYMNPADFRCPKPCKSILVCGHKCVETCGDAHTKRCKALVASTWPCGHTAQIECYMMDVSSAPCPHKCEDMLNCEHQCNGTCGSCSRGRLHKPCAHKCNRTLVCGHICLDFCLNCPPCTRSCENRCSHSKCSLRCGMMCVPCTEPCSWKCKHHKCTNLCSEFCNRPRCNRACPKNLPCKHKCIGICGEPCPKLCRVCNKEEVADIFFGTEDEPDARFIALEDCVHVIEVSGLDTWMDGTATTDSSVSIKLKECPRCKTPIRRNLRYGNIIKKTLNDIEQVKTRKAGEQQIPSQLTVILNQFAVHFSGRNAIQIIANNPPYEMLLISLQNKLELLKCADALMEKVKKSVDRFTKEIALHKICNEIISLKRFIIDHLSRVGDQLVDECSKELTRLSLFNSLLILSCAIDERQISIPSDLRRKLNTAIHTLSENKPLSEEEAVAFKRIIADVKNVVPESGLGISEVERCEIVKAMGLSRGHWYTCPRGHIYAIGDCGGATVEGICPECHSAIGGTSHQLLATNRLASEMDGAQYSAWSQQANMQNYDLE